MVRIYRTATGREVTRLGFSKGASMACLTVAVMYFHYWSGRWRGVISVGELLLVARWAQEDAKARGTTDARYRGGVVLYLGVVAACAPPRESCRRRSSRGIWDFCYWSIAGSSPTEIDHVWGMDPSCRPQNADHLCSGAASSPMTLAKMRQQGKTEGRSRKGRMGKERGRGRESSEGRAGF